MRIFLVIACALCLGACGTPHKTYHAPSSAKVKAATVDLNAKVDRARETAAKVKKLTEEARKALARAVNLSSGVKELLEKLIVKLPAYAGPLREITDNVDELISTNKALEEQLRQLVAWNLQLETQLIEAEKARATLQKAQDEYAGGAASLAGDATDEREQRIKVEGKLSWYRWRWWGSWIVLGASAVAWIIFGVLKLGVRIWKP